jgi:hypothetical protein
VTLVVATLALVGAAASKAATASIIDRAATALESSPVYVDPTAEKTISFTEAEQLRTEIETKGHGPIYIAVLPGAAVDEAGGRGRVVPSCTVGSRGAACMRSSRRPSRAGFGLPAGQAGELATDAFREHHPKASRHARRFRRPSRSGPRG